MPYRTILALMLAFTVAAATSCGGQGDAPGESAAPETMKPAIATSLDQIIAPGATLEKITGDMTFDNTNSPCWAGGVLYFTNNNFNPATNSRTYRMEADGAIKLLAEDNGVIATLCPTGMGTLYACEMTGHRISELNMDGSVIRTVAGSYNGNRLDGPNGMVVDSKGGIYFTDSRYSPGSELMQDKPAVYYVNSAGDVSRIIDDINFPNGVALSPDGKTLYVTNTNGPDKGEFVFACDVNEDGTVTNKRQFATVMLTERAQSSRNGSSGADGCTVDSAGNLYVATNQGLGVQVFNVAGEYLGAINTGVTVNNCAFGGGDLSTLYVTGQDGVYAIPTLISGLAALLK